jgi:DNA-binding NarL/FixJ family response regulator
VWLAVWRSPRRCGNHQGMTSVLIVDDYAPFRATARALLEAEGFRVVGEASSADEAVAAACRERPDLVLLDVQLPDGDGFHAAERLTSTARGVNVVLVSSRDYSNFAALVERSGARGFLPKAELSGARLVQLLAS